MWYFDNHTRCENLHTLEALQERDSCRHYKTLAVQAAQWPCGLGEGLSLLREDGRNALAAAYTRVSQNSRAARETRPKEGWALAQESKMYANGADDQRDKKDEQDEHAGGVFGDLSFAQILATALAAGVSFALSSQIGVAGSLIGAIVGAAAATVASSVLNNLFSKSAEAIKGAVSTDANESPTAEKPAAASAAGETSLMPHPVDADQAAGANAPAGATATQNLAAGETRPATASLADDTEVKFAPSGTRIAPASLRRAVHESQRRDTKRRLVVVSVVAGIAAVLISALLVNALTQGKGIGTTPGRTQETTATEQAQTTKEQTEAEKPEEMDKSEKSAESDSTQSTDTSSNSDTTGSTTDSTTSNSGTSSNSGNSSSNSDSSSNSSSSSNNSSSSTTGDATGSSSSTNSGSNSSSNSDSSNSSSSTDSTKGNVSTSATKGTGSSSGSTGSGATTSGTSGN